MQTRPLPPFCYPGRSRPIRGVVLHFISGINVEPSAPFDMQVCWNLLHDLNLLKAERKFYPNCTPGADRVYASYNELIGRERGEDWLLVPAQKEVWHAGTSLHKGQPGCNKFMFGLAFAATEKSGYTDWQYERAAEVCASLMSVEKFGMLDIVGHDQVRHNAILAGMKADPKKDPSGKADGTGTNFDWPRFRRMVSDALRLATAG